MTYHNDLSVPPLKVCPNCGRKGLRDVFAPTGVKVDDLKPTGKRCRYFEYVE